MFLCSSPCSLSFKPALFLLLSLTLYLPHPLCLFWLFDLLNLTSKVEHWAAFDGGWCGSSIIHSLFWGVVSRALQGKVVRERPSCDWEDATDLAEEKQEPRLAEMLHLTPVYVFDKQRPAVMSSWEKRKTPELVILLKWHLWKSRDWAESHRTCCSNRRKDSLWISGSMKSATETHPSLGRILFSTRHCFLVCMKTIFV